MSDIPPKIWSGLKNWERKLIKMTDGDVKNDVRNGAN